MRRGGQPRREGALRASGGGNGTAARRSRAVGGGAGKPLHRPETAGDEAAIRETGTGAQEGAYTSANRTVAQQSAATETSYARREVRGVSWAVGPAPEER